ncbi:MAG: hypothetical protein BM560_15785 [Roseobacter sp. MedPE-SWde]|nr:MAG: hypothetical protein BM560_15785 [Roseobacter sp. MedPE-SWde]
MMGYAKPSAGRAKGKLQGCVGGERAPCGLASGGNIFRKMIGYPFALPLTEVRTGATLHM